MFAYKLSNGVTVSLASESQDEVSLIEYSGKADDVELTRRFVSASYGPFGDLILDAASPVDLDAAMSVSRELKELNPQLVEGSVKVTSYGKDPQNDQDD
jgi:hypothetical protein